MTRFIATIVLLIFALSTAHAQGARRYDDLEMFAIKYNGVERSLGLYIAHSYSKDSKAPLIVALHGAYSSAKALHALSRLQDIAEARGAILLYPESAGGFWEGEDPGFITFALQSILAEYTVDRDRIFLVGYATGGAMAYRLACQAPVHFAGAAVVSALMWQATASLCSAGTSPTSMLIIHGRDSKLFPVGGSPQTPAYTSARLSVSDTLAFWRNTNHCPSQPTITGNGDSALYAGCDAGTSLAYVGIPGASQDWFRSAPGYKLNQHGVSATAAIDSFFFDRGRFQLPAGQEIKGRPRDWLVHVPPQYGAARPMPLVLMLHGRPSSAIEMAAISRMNATADRHGFIVVYPEGLNNEWNAQFDMYAKSSGSVRVAQAERPVLTQDDVGFLKTLTEDLRLDLNIDPQRMFVSGFSNGGFMTLRMACSASDTFAGFAEVGSALYTVMTGFCKTGRPAPMLFMHGSDDPSIPIGGVEISDASTGRSTHVTLSVKDTVTYFAQRNHCDLAGTSTSFTPSGRSPGTSVTRFVPHNCAPGAAIEFYIIQGGGHTWPGVPGILPENRFGKVNMDIEASEVIWKFFEPQRLGN